MTDPTVRIDPLLPDKGQVEDDDDDDDDDFYDARSEVSIWDIEADYDDDDDGQFDDDHGSGASHSSGTKTKNWTACGRQRTTTSPQKACIVQSCKVCWQ
jgi:hypothetical protein